MIVSSASSLALYDSLFSSRFASLTPDLNAASPKRFSNPAKDFKRKSASSFSASAETNLGRMGAYVCGIKLQRLAIFTVFSTASGRSAKSSIISDEDLK